MQRRSFLSTTFAAIAAFFTGKRTEAAPEPQPGHPYRQSTTSTSPVEAPETLVVRREVPELVEGYPCGPFEDVDHVDLFSLFEEASAYARKHGKPVFAADDPVSFPPTVGWCCDSSEPGAYGKHWRITVRNIKRSLDNCPDRNRAEIVSRYIKTAESRRFLAQALGPGNPRAGSRPV